MGKVLFMRKGETHTVPVGSLLLSNIAEGSIVYINENGVATPFYVAKHDYESGLNGAGRSLIVRKDCYTSGAWTSIYSSYWGAYAALYSGSTIDTWFNSTYKTLLDSVAQSAMGTTKFYYTPNGIDYKESSNVSRLSRSVFALSLTELGWGGPTRVYNQEGSALPIASTLRPLKQWTRTPYAGTPENINSAYELMTNGQCNSINASNGSSGYRPAFTLPSNAMFDEETLILKGVS